jgi:hypothetical protein
VLGITPFRIANELNDPNHVAFGNESGSVTNPLSTKSKPKDTTPTPWIRTHCKCLSLVLVTFIIGAVAVVVVILFQQKPDGPTQGTYRQKEIYNFYYHFVFSSSRLFEQTLSSEPQIELNFTAPGN